MNLQKDVIESLTREVANNDKDAIEFINLWLIYCHKFDDLVDEKFCLEDLISCNNELTRLLTSKFFQQHKEYLIGQIYLAAESYKSSEDLKVSAKQDERLLGEYVSHEGNNMLLTVALIIGGYNHLIKIAPKIRELTYVEHPLVVKNV